MTWEIEPVGDSCLLTVTHDQLREGANNQLYGGWPMILSGIKTLLETGEILTTPGSLRWLQGNKQQLPEVRDPAVIDRETIDHQTTEGTMNMPKLVVYNSVSLDGYFTDANGDMSWAHKRDPEWQAFVSENASGGGQLLFGRVTYDLMASFWPTPLAAQSNPIVAERMNSLRKFVFSRTLDKASWSNTTLLKGDLAAEVRKLKQEPGPTS